MKYHMKQKVKQNTVTSKTTKKNFSHYVKNYYRSKLNSETAEVYVIITENYDECYKQHICLLRSYGTVVSDIIQLNMKNLEV